MSTRKESDASVSVRLANILALPQTIIFMEVGLPDEETLPGQTPASYLGRAYGGPANIVARYNKTNTDDINEKREELVNLVFGDGHVETLPVKDILDPSGQPYSPQLQKDGGKGKVVWTPDPETRIGQ